MALLSVCAGEHGTLVLFSSVLYLLTTSVWNSFIVVKTSTNYLKDTSENPQVFLSFACSELWNIAQIDMNRKNDLAISRILKAE